MNVYEVPLVSPVTVQEPPNGEPLGDVTLQVRPPGVAVMVKDAGVPPVPLSVTVTVAPPLPATADGWLGVLGVRTVGDGVATVIVTELVAESYVLSAAIDTWKMQVPSETALTVVPLRVQVPVLDPSGPDQVIAPVPL